MDVSDICEDGRDLGIMLLTSLRSGSSVDEVREGDGEDCVECGFHDDGFERLLFVV
jgi:hypothetical protein